MGKRVLHIMGKIGKGFAGVLGILLSLTIIIAVVGANIAAMNYEQMLMVVSGDKDYKIEGGSGTQYYTSDFKTKEEALAYEEEICKQIEAEGIVLLKNEEAALPLGQSAKISLLGQDSVDMVYGGVGAGSVDSNSAPNLKEALEKSGFRVNPVLWDFYDTGAASGYRKEVASVTGAGGFAVNEVPVDLYTEEVKASFAEYDDAALVVLGRSGGESADITYETGENGVNYLQITPEERDTIELACENFETVVVILNVNNSVEAGFLEEYDIDACLWIGGVGQSGAYAVGQVLSGEVNPSGSLVDTWAYDNSSAPAMANFGDYTITNSEVTAGNKYMVYAENIYVGYRYYETRYEDVVLGNEAASNYDYGSQVQFPFGYGLSYTEFSWSDYRVAETTDGFEIELTVTNTGDAAGKETVQIYMQSPYTEYDREKGIEKSSVELVGYEKTGSLKPGESCTVGITVQKEALRVYDARGCGTYIVDAGDYYFAAGSNAHEALNNILAPKEKTETDGMDIAGRAELTWQYVQNTLDSDAYSTSASTGNNIGNQFGEADICTYDEDFTYLSRSDWQGTFPALYQGGNWEADEELLAGLEVSYTENTADEMPKAGAVSEEYGELTVAELREADYDDLRWEALVAQLNLTELHDLVRRGGYATQTVESIGLPGTVDKDGPAGISSTLVGGTSCMAYPTEMVWASTWNRELVEEAGRLIGEDSLSAGVTVWYAPAMNIHRTPFSGRNFEYYSEDGYLSGTMAAAEVKGAMEKGVIVTIKHFALNDQETNRIGVSVFASEQSIRELYLKGFEIAVREGHANGVMNSMNRIGTRWAGGHAGLMTEVLRSEWGFMGFAVTDQTSFGSFSYCDLREGLEAGTDLWLNTSKSMWKLSEEEFTTTVVTNLQRAAKKELRRQRKGQK